MPTLELLRCLAEAHSIIGYHYVLSIATRHKVPIESALDICIQICGKDGETHTFEFLSLPFSIVKSSLDIESVLGGLRLSYGEGMESVPYQTGLTFEAFPFI